MKKSIVFLLLIFGSTINAQNWQAITSNTTDEIKDMYFQNENTGFAVAGQGKILKTIDGGNNWNLIYENSELYQEQVIVATNDKVICFGQNFQGDIKVLKFYIAQNDFNLTTTTGLFAVPQKLVNYNNSIFGNGFQYSDDNFTILTGVSSSTSEINNNVNNLSTSDGHNIYFSSNGSIWNTIEFHLPFLSSYPYQSFYDGISKMRTVTNYPCVVHISNDNGLNWTYNQINIQALYFYYINAENVLGVNLFSQANPENKIFYSVDSGINFNFEIVSNPIKKIYKYNSNLIFAFGDNGVIYKSINAGGLLSTNEIEKKENLINIYPNPINDGFMFFNYDVNEVKINSVSIVNILGEVIIVLKDDFDAINANSFSDGIYLLKFDTTKGIITKKIIRK